MNCCSLVSLNLENGRTDLVNFGLELFVEVQRRFRGKVLIGKTNINQQITI